MLFCTFQVSLCLFVAEIYRLLQRQSHWRYQTAHSNIIFLAFCCWSCWNFHKQRILRWEIMPCSPSKVKRCFAVCFILLAWLIHQPWKSTQYITLKRRFSFNGLHGIISDKRDIFITTGVRTSIPTSKNEYDRYSVITVGDEMCGRTDGHDLPVGTESFSC
jgi:hypothetical protein